MGAWRVEKHGALRAVAGIILAGATLFVVVACDNGGTGTGVPTPNGPTPTVPQALAAGQRIFQQYCNVCHPGGHRAAGPSLINNPRGDDEIARVIRQGHRPMPAFGPEAIPDGDMPSLIAYIRSLK